VAVADAGRSIAFWNPRRAEQAQRVLGKRVKTQFKSLAIGLTDLKLLSPSLGLLASAV
jgi:hypothetical protein